MAPGKTNPLRGTLMEDRFTTYGRTPDAPGLSQSQLAALGAGRISGNRVATRTDSGKKLSYVEAWDVKATLIKIFGFGGFSVELLESQVLAQFEKPQSSNPNKMNAVVVIRATVRLTIHATGAVYTEAATGQNAQPDIGKAFDTALKSAESDALKRAAVFLGTQFGLSLYAKTTNDVCRPILQPEQQAIRAAIEAGKDADVQAHLDRATGQENIAGAEDAAAEEAAWKPEDETQAVPQEQGA
jgi:recombination DNA repair RAD52 pathway protein